MEKYGDLIDYGEHVKVSTGPLKGKEGLLKEASGSTLKIQLKSGEIIEVDESCCTIGIVK
jgi:ribosomal protein L24